MTMPKNWQLYLVLGFAFALLPNEAAPDGVEGADKGSKAIPGPGKSLENQLDFT